MADSSHFMTVNGNLCLQRFIAVPPPVLYTELGARSPAAEPPGTRRWRPEVRCGVQQRQAKPGWFYFCARYRFRFVGGLHAEVRAGFKQHKFNSQLCQMFPVFSAGTSINSKAAKWK